VIVPADDDFDVAAVISQVAERIADYKVPQYVSVRREPLPRNAGGNFKRQLREGVDWGEASR
jgi:acyl-CoA synthetase (AMP-forming)/AMP-acid ligase II